MTKNLTCIFAFAFAVGLAAFAARPASATQGGLPGIGEQAMAAQSQVLQFAFSPVRSPPTCKIFLVAVHRMPGIQRSSMGPLHFRMCMSNAQVT